MNIRLNPHSEEILREQMASGGFRTPEEVIEHALESLAAQEGRERRPQPEAGASILELQGLGKKIWKGIDGQEYVNRERASWNG